MEQQPTDAPQNVNAPLSRGIHPLHLLFLILSAALAAPILFYALFLFLFLLMPGSFD
jgi:hypothetical protein